LTTNRCKCGALASYVMLPTLARSCGRCLVRHGNTVHVWTKDGEVVTDGSKRTMFELKCSDVRAAYMTLILDEARFSLNTVDHLEDDKHHPEAHMRTYTRKELLGGPLAGDKVNPVDRGSFARRSPKGKAWRATFAVQVLLPFYDRKNRVARRPRLCIACTESINIASWVKTYTDEEFIKHFDECEDAQRDYKHQIRNIRGEPESTSSRFLDSDLIRRLLEESQD
jgi:hypothetical protein